MKHIRMFFLKIILLYLLPIELFAQSPDTLWTKTFGDTLDDIGTGVLQTKNGDFIVSGYSSKPIIIRTNSIGVTSWTKKYFLSEFSSVQPSPPIYEYENGNIIIGTILSGGLLKINPDGDSLYWELLYPACYWLMTTCGVNAFYQSSGESFIFSLWGCSDISCSYQIFLNEFKSNSDSLNLCWDFQPEFSCSKIIQTKNGNIIVLGTGWYGPLFLISIDKITGDTLWTKNMGNSEENRVYGKSLTESFNTGFIILSDCFNEDMWGSIGLIKTNEVGDSLYSKFYGGSGSDAGEHITNTSDGGYIIVGSTNSFGAGKSDVWLLKTDEYGDTLWTKTLGGTEDDFGVYVQETSDKGYIVVGTTYSYGNGGSDIWLIRLGSDPTSVKNENPYLNNFMVYQNYPNPFNASTKISWQSPVSSWQVLKVFDVLGNEVATLLDEEMEAGYHSIDLNASELPSGVYFYRIQAVPSSSSGQVFVETKKLLFLK